MGHRIRSLIGTPPRVAELLFLAVLIWLFATGQGWSVLLADGDTGWHIRNGEQILATRSVPHSDPFSFATSGHPWFAWEWLSDVLFAALFRLGGLKAVTVFCGLVIAASVTVLFRHMVWRSVSLAVAFPLTMLAVGASSIHYLARPHAIGLLFFAILAWMIDRDRASPGRPAWWLPLLLMVWANCHGSFLAGLAMLGLWFGESWFRRRADPRNVLRPALVAAVSGGATLCNPYGFHLHAHALAYLRSTWIQDTIEEFQSPRFRSENMLQYEVLLFAGLMALAWLSRRGEFYPCAVILLWAHESLASVRHVPLYCLASGPFAASWIEHLWKRVAVRCPRGSFLGAIESVNFTWSSWSRGFTVWSALFAGAVGAAPFVLRQPVGFPANKFPETLVERCLPRFSDRQGVPRRIFSSDQWSDYLIFRFYPKVRVYFDGRSDFFGPWRGDAYLHLMAGREDSPAILAREDIDLALVPRDWALAGILLQDPQWEVVDADGRAALFVRRREPEIAFNPNQEPPARR